MLRTLLLISALGISSLSYAGPDCSNSVAGNLKKHVIVKQTMDYTMQCGAVASPFSLGRPVTIRFQIFDKDSHEPAANISFAPVIMGSRDACATNPSVAEVTGTSPNCSVDPWEYHGIVTPREEWCTDENGIAVIEFVPMCLVQAQDINTQIISGAIFSENHLTIMAVDE